MGRHHCWAADPLELGLSLYILYPIYYQYIIHYTILHGIRGLGLGFLLPPPTPAASCFHPEDQPPPPGGSSFPPEGGHTPAASPWPPSLPSPSPLRPEPPLAGHGGRRRPPLQLASNTVAALHADTGSTRSRAINAASRRAWAGGGAPTLDGCLSPWRARPQPPPLPARARSSALPPTSSVGRARRFPWRRPPSSQPPLSPLLARRRPRPRLLKYQNAYWKQRYTERWVKLGD
jgi:hypothetical protein